MYDVFIRIPQGIEDRNEEQINSLLVEFISDQSNKIRSLTVDFDPESKTLRTSLRRKCKKNFVKLTLVQRTENTVLYEIAMT